MSDPYLNMTLLSGPLRLNVVLLLLRKCKGGLQSAYLDSEISVMPRSLTMFVVGNETPFRQREEVWLVLCFLLISKIQHFSTDNITVIVMCWPIPQCTLMQN